MGIKQNVMDGMKAAMKAHDQFRLDALRMLKAAIMQKEVATGAQRDLSEEETMAVVQSLAKQRRDSADQYVKAGRQDLADLELRELKIAEEFLPAAASEAEIAAAVDAAVAATGASGPKDMGKVMKAVKELLAGKPADGAALSARVKARLG
ncbi:MAG: GatB/YqeY domain-containing protein [Candidatus Brocadiae bacterium]|nr:GatB/YqeY domain-containing protein [Candidatus Brocadiia bacterium]